MKGLLAGTRYFPLALTGSALLGREAGSSGSMRRIFAEHGGEILAVAGNGVVAVADVVGGAAVA